MCMRARRTTARWRCVGRLVAVSGLRIKQWPAPTTLHATPRHLPLLTRVNGPPHLAAFIFYAKFACPVWAHFYSPHPLRYLPGLHSLAVDNLLLWLGVIVGSLDMALGTINGDARRLVMAVAGSGGILQRRALAAWAGCGLASAAWRGRVVATCLPLLCHFHTCLCRGLGKLSVRAGSAGMLENWKGSSEIRHVRHGLSCNLLAFFRHSFTHTIPFAHSAAPRHATRLRCILARRVSANIKRGQHARTAKTFAGLIYAGGCYGARFSMRSPRWHAHGETAAGMAAWRGKRSASPEQQNNRWKRLARRALRNLNAKGTL